MHFPFKLFMDRYIFMRARYENTFRTGAFYQIIISPQSD